jgi:hypothetical protein
LCNKAWEHSRYEGSHQRGEVIKQGTRKRARGTGGQVMEDQPTMQLKTRRRHQVKAKNQTYQPLRGEYPRNCAVSMKGKRTKTCSKPKEIGHKESRGSQTRPGTKTNLAEGGDKRGQHKENEIFQKGKAK